MAADRYPTKEKAEVEIYGRDGGIIAKIKDLSKTGACISWETDQFQIQIGDLLRMRVILRALKKEHRVNAEVVWTNGKSSGVQFLSSHEVVEKMLYKGAI